MFRKALLALALLGAIVAGAAGYGYYRLQTEVSSGRLAQRVANLMWERTGQKVTLGSITLTDLRNAEASGVRVRGTAPGSPELVCEKAKVTIVPLDLVQGRLTIERVTLVRPEIQLAVASDAPPALALDMLPRVDEAPLPHIQITEGKLTYREQSWPQDKAIVYSDVSGDVRLAAPGATEVIAGFNGKLSSGKMALSGAYDSATRLCQVSARVTGFDVGPLLAAMPGTQGLPVKIQQLPLESQLTLLFKEGRLTDVNGTAQFTGGEAVVSETDLPIHDLGGDMKVAGGVLEIGSLSGNLPGNIPVRLSGKVSDVLGSRTLALTVEIPESGKGKLAGRIALTGTAASPSAEGEIVPKGFVWPAAVGTATVPIELIEGKLVLTPQKLATDNLVVKVGGQPVDVAASVLDYTGKKSWTAHLKAASADVANLLALVPPAARQRAAAWQPEGKLTVVADASGSGTEYRIEGELVPESLAVKLPVGSGTLPARITAGKIRLTQTEAACDNLAVEVDGTPATVAFKVTDLMGEPAISATAKAAMLPVQKAAAALPEELRKQLGPYKLAGSVGVDASIDWQAGKLKMSGSIDASGLSGELVQAGQAVAFEVERGQVLSEGDKLTTKGLVVACSFPGKATPAPSRFEVTGSAFPMPEPKELDVQLKGEKIELAALSSLAPTGPVQIQGLADITGSAKGPIGALQGSIAIGLEGIVVRHPALPGPLVGKSGKLAFDGNVATLENARFEAGGSAFTADGRVLEPLGDAKLDGMKVSGAVSLAEVQGMMSLPPGVGISGKGTMEARLDGVRTSVGFTGQGQFESVALTAARTGATASRIELQKVEARFEGTPGALKMSSLTGSFYGGDLRLSTDGAAGKPLACSVNLAGADFGKFVADQQDLPGVFSGTLEAKMQFDIPAGAGVGSIGGVGRADVRDLAIDGSKLAGVAPILATTVATGTPFGAAVAYALKKHDIGHVRYAFTADAGKISGPVKSEAGKGVVEGKLDIDLGSSRATGQFSLRSADGPRALELRNVQLDTSRQPPVSVANAAAEIAYTGPEGRYPPKPVVVEKPPAPKKPRTRKRQAEEEEEPPAARPTPRTAATAPAPEKPKAKDEDEDDDRMPVIIIEQKGRRGTWMERSEGGPQGLDGIN